MEGTSDNIFNLFFDYMVLLLLGYYDGVIFHRIVPGFLVQTGDRTGTGGGGESFYGDWFEDEIHPRLRFAHRGLVAMANNGQKNSNDSQFFITLGKNSNLRCLRSATFSSRSRRRASRQT